MSAAAARDADLVLEQLLTADATTWSTTWVEPPPDEEDPYMKSET